MSQYPWEDGEYEQREYQRKLLADEFVGMSHQEMEDEIEYLEQERNRIVARNK